MVGSQYECARYWSPCASQSQFWVSPDAGEECVGWSQLKPTALFSTLVVVQTLYCTLGWVVCSLPLPPWLTQGDIHTFLMNLGRKIYSASWSTQLLIAVYLKPRPLSSPPCAEVKSASLQQLWSVTPGVIPWAAQVHPPCPSPLSLFLL